MQVTGPFRNPQRKGSKKPWYLSYFAPKLGPDNTPQVVDGKPVLERKRPHYESKAAAEADRERITNQYAAAGSGSFVHSREAQAEYEAAKKLLPAGESLVTAARYFAKHHPRTDAVFIEMARERYLLQLEKLAEKKHNSDTKWRTAHFTAAFPGRVPASIQRSEIMSYLLALPWEPRGILNQKRAVCSFFAWMLTEASLIDSNPAGGIKRKQLPKVLRKEIEFLKLEEAEAYLRATERYDPEIVAHEIVQLFAGVRADDEMADFKGEWVKASTKEVVTPSEITKTGAREVIGNLEENFWEWWAIYGREGLLRPKNYRKRHKRVRVLAATDNRSQADALARLPIDGLLGSPTVSAKLLHWPWNARRRTFCTYHVAMHQSAGKTALILRHKGGENTLHNSYRGTGVTQPQGAAYFSIKPRKVTHPVSPAKHWRVVANAAAESPA